MWSLKHVFQYALCLLRVLLHSTIILSKKSYILALTTSDFDQNDEDLASSCMCGAFVGPHRLLHNRWVVASGSIDYSGIETRVIT